MKFLDYVTDPIYKMMAALFAWAERTFEVDEEEAILVGILFGCAFFGGTNT